MTSLPHVNREQKKQYTVPCLIAAQIPWVSFWARQDEKWGSFCGQFEDHFRVGDHFGVGIISGPEQIRGQN